MEAFWDILEKAAILVRLSGLDVITLITMVMSLTQFYKNKRQCWKLERRLQVLHALLQRPTGCWAAIQHSKTGDSIRKELKDANDLVESYKKSTLWSHLRWGRSTASQFRDMRNVIDANLLIIQANLCPPDVRISVNDDGSGGMPTATGSSAGAEVSSSVADIHGQEGIGSDTDTTGDSTRMGNHPCLPSYIV